eukprot:m.1048204 g.1048204  ORF g.1048204 m.1048204 type:complete len:82 (+) comp24172_c0_seq30:2054-2299(+)
MVVIAPDSGVGNITSVAADPFSGRRFPAALRSFESPTTKRLPCLVETPNRFIFHASTKGCAAHVCINALLLRQISPPPGDV